MLILIGALVLAVVASFAAIMYERATNERNFYRKKNIQIESDVYSVYVIPRQPGEETRAAKKLHAVKHELLRILDNAPKYIHKYPFRVCNPEVVLGRIARARDTLEEPDSISETVDSRDDAKTSYTISKTKIFMCIRHGYYKTPKKNESPSFKIYPMRTIMFPAIHEMAHVVCTSIGHTEEFRELNGFLLSVAKAMGIEVSKDFNRGVYCGMQIDKH